MEQDNNKPKPNKLSDQIDSKEDREKMKQEPVEINIPDLEDVTGLDKIPPASTGDMDSLTVSSASEEGDNLFDNDLDKAIRNDPESNVSDKERKLLRRASHDMGEDDKELREAALDSTDEDGTPLNEGSFNRNISASDLDVPGADLDDADEDIGSEDEENNEYSLGGDDHPNN